MTLALSGREIAALTSIWSHRGEDVVVAFGGTSMLPAISPGQRVILRFRQPPSIGDVVAYRTGDRIVVHRLVEKGDDGSWFLAWGDANGLPDQPFPPERLVAVVAAAEVDGSFKKVSDGKSSFARRFLLRLVASARSSMRGVARRVNALHQITRRRGAVLDLRHT
jgi:signal peptidase I